MKEKTQETDPSDLRDGYVEPVVELEKEWTQARGQCVKLSCIKKTQYLYGSFNASST